MSVSDICFDSNPSANANTDAALRSHSAKQHEAVWQPRSAS